MPRPPRRWRGTSFTRFPRLLVLATTDTTSPAPRAQLHPHPPRLLLPPGPRCLGHVPLPGSSIVFSSMVDSQNQTCHTRVRNHGAFRDVARYLLALHFNVHSCARIPFSSHTSARVYSYLYIYTTYTRPPVPSVIPSSSAFPSRPAAPRPSRSTHRRHLLPIPSTPWPCSPRECDSPSPSLDDAAPRSRSPRAPAPSSSASLHFPPPSRPPRGRRPISLLLLLLRRRLAASVVQAPHEAAVLAAQVA